MAHPDQQAAARAIVAFLNALGHEPTGDLEQTPALVAQAFCEDLLAGYGVDPAQTLRDGAVELAAEHPGLVVLRDLAVTTVCPHHLLPAHGDATVAYWPTRKVAGFGAIAKMVDACTRRLTFQEQAGRDVASLLVAGLGARGALCHLRLVHGCLVARGARQASAVVESVGLAGSFTRAGADQQLALTALGPAPAAVVRAQTSPDRCEPAGR